MKLSPVQKFVLSIVKPLAMCQLSIFDIALQGGLTDHSTERLSQLADGIDAVLSECHSVLGCTDVSSPEPCDSQKLHIGN